MEEFLTTLRPFYDIGSTGLLAVTVILLLTGRLVPRSAVNDWKAAYDKSQEAHAVKDRIIVEMAEANTVSVRALDALPTPNGGESDVSTTAETRRRRRQG